MKTTEQLKEEYEAARLATKEAEEAYRRAEREEEAARRELIWDVCSVRVGSIVRRLRDSKVFRVSLIGNWWRNQGMPSADGNPQKKDGSFSEQRQYIGSDYEVITA